MENWANIQLSKIFRLTNGKSISANYLEVRNNEYCIPVFGGNSILGYAKKYLIDDNTLVIGRVGEYCGNINIIDGKVWVSDNALYISKWLIKCDIKFLFYLLIHIDLNKYSDATGQPKITQSLLRRIKPLFPTTIHEQIAIATILSKVDEAIEAIRQSIKAAEKLRKALMQNLLTGKLKPDGSWRNDDEFYEDEKFGKVPVGWVVAKVKDYGFVQTGKTPPTVEENVFAESKDGNSYMFITPSDLGKRKYINESERYVTERGISYSYKLPANSICVVCIGSTIGKICVNEKEACSNQQINALIPNDENSGEFFYYMMEFRKPHFKEIAGINAMPQINKSDFNKYKLLRPNEKLEQEKIALILKVLDKENNSKQTKIQTLQRLKKSLMQNLLTGKARVDAEAINKLISEK